MPERTVETCGEAEPLIEALNTIRSMAERAQQRADGTEDGDQA